MGVRKKLFGTNGIRFRPGIDHGVDFVVQVAEAIGTYFRQGPLLIGHDGRVSGPMLSKGVASGLMSVGLDVCEAGLVPTPSLQYAVRRLGYTGGVMITASHNPPEYNGVKVMGPDGVEVSREDEAAIEKIYFDRTAKLADWQSVGHLYLEMKTVPTYIDSVVSRVDKDLIRRRSFKVVVDPGNGVQAVAAPYILKKLGCHVTTLNGHVDGFFPGRGPEPTIENLKGLSDAVKNSGADLGVAYDGDGDRSIFCDERGVVHWGDVTGTLLAEYLGSKSRNILIVTPISTSQIISIVVEKYGAKILWTRVGSVDVTRMMIREKALFGFEENGGCLYAPHLPARDGSMATALLLEALVGNEETLSQKIDRLPRFYQRKTKFECPTNLRQRVMKEVEKNAKGSVERIDGLKIWPDQRTWVLIRPSGTEPLIRMFAEADTKDKVDETVERFGKIIKEVLSH